MYNCLFNEYCDGVFYYYNFLKYVPCCSLMIGFFRNQMLKEILGKIGNKNSYLKHSAVISQMHRV